ncbi:hypothetical protein O181_122367, partial [Austropuccinia psidii MF-1]|nr:hypothetical protein [Austropuccinia psidii MF-1]
VYFYSILNIPVQNSPPASQTKSQAITKAVLTKTLKDPLDSTPSVPQLRAKLDRGPIWKEGRGPIRSSLFSGVAGAFPGISTTLPRGLGEGNSEEEDSMEEEESDSIEPAPATVGAFQVPVGPTIAQSNLPVFHKPPAFNTPYMKAPDYFNRTVPFKIGDWGERAIINHFAKEVASRILNQLDSNPSSIYSLQDSMDITLELDTRSSDKKKDLRGQRRNKPHSSLLNRDHRLMGSEKERRIKEGLRAYLGGRNSLEACVKNPQNQVTQPEGRFTSQVEA